MEITVAETTERFAFFYGATGEATPGMDSKARGRNDVTSVCHKGQPHMLAVSLGTPKASLLGAAKQEWCVT